MRLSRTKEPTLSSSATAFGASAAAAVAVAVTAADENSWTRGWVAQKGGSGPNGRASEETKRRGRKWAAHAPTLQNSTSDQWDDRVVVEAAVFRKVTGGGGDVMAKSSSPSSSSMLSSLSLSEYDVPPPFSSSSSSSSSSSPAAVPVERYVSSIGRL